MTRNVFTSARMLLWGVVTTAILMAGAVQAQAPAGRGQMEKMMAERQAMMADMKAAHAKLDELVAKMNAATGQAKIDQVAAVVTELVAQHKAMHDRMMSMQGGMMKQMMQRGGPAAAAPPAEEPRAKPD